MPLSRKNSPEDIYFYRSELPPVDTSSVFVITKEDDKLRVKNKNINCLFYSLTAKQFGKHYNDFYKHLNLDFSPLIINTGKCYLTKDEQSRLTEEIITSIIYFYTINSLPVKVKRDDFTHPSMIDHVLTVLDKKYGVDTELSLLLGAKILRQNLEEYINTVRGRRMYYDK